MKHYLYITMAAVLLLTMTVSCSKDFLDKTPEGEYIEDNFYDSDDALYASTATLYNRAWFDYNNRGMLCIGSLRPNDAYSPHNWKEYTLFTVDALETNLSDIWKGFFSVVTLANSIIDNIENKSTSSVSTTAKNIAIGEARLMRGVALFYALHAWGPLVLFEHNQDVVDNPVRPRNYEEDVFKFVINDLTYAAEHLPTSPFAEGRATCWSAKAMLAKVYLSRSGWGKSSRDESDLAQAKKYALDVIEHSGSKLLDDYHNLFKYRYNNNEETLLACQWYKSASGDKWYVKNSTISDLCADSKMIGGVMCWSALRASADMLIQYRYKASNGTYKWEKIRRDATFFLPGIHYDYICIADGGYEYDGKDAPIKKGVVGGPNDDNDGYVSFMNSPLNTYIIRLADVYLIYTEACLGNNATLSGDDLKYFNAVRRRAGIEEATSITFEDIIRERRVEFGMEYMNWYCFMDWYMWKPNYMINYMNNQYRGYTYNEVKVEDNDELKFYNEDQYVTTVTTEFGDLVVPDVIPTVSKSNVFLPYPEADVIQNPYLKQEPVHYNFNE